MAVWDWIGRQLARVHGTSAPSTAGMDTLRGERAYLAEMIKHYSAASLRLTPGMHNPTGEDDTIRNYYPVMLKEPTLKAAFFGSMFAVASLDLVVKPADKRNPKDKEVAEFVHHYLTRRRGNVLHLVEGMGYGGRIHGYSVCEKVKEVESRGKWAGKIVLKELKPKDVSQGRIYLEVDSYNNLTAIQANHPNRGQRFDPKDFVVFTYLRIFGAHTGMSDLRAVYRAVTLKEQAIKLRMIALDKYSGPYLKGKYGDEKTRAGLATALAQARANGYITISQADEVEVINLALAGTSDFKAAIDDLDREIAIGISFASLHMMTGKVGEERGSATVQQQTSEVGQWYMAALIGAAINEQMIPDAVDLNFGPEYDLPTVQLGGISPDAILKELAVDKMLHEMGVDGSLEAIRDRAQRQPPTGPDDTLKGMTPLGALGGGAPLEPFRG